jgi:exopolysaccharide biosynthesis predicted pyruvyltransferase EpsI
MGFSEMIKKAIRSSQITRSLFGVYSVCLDSGLSLARYLKADKINYVFMVPTHNNAGDAAQTVCINDWLREHYPDYTTYNVSIAAPLNAKLLREICQRVRKEDQVFIHSGFNMTDVATADGVPESVYASHKIIMEELKGRRIVFFPQTVQFLNPANREKMRSLYCDHRDILFLSRDTVSEQYARELIPNARHISYPDIVTSWIGRFDFPQEASGILACLRFGPESLFDEDERRLLMRRLGAVAETERSDTNFTMKSHALRRNREKIVLDMIEQFSKYKVIVTDRYHGMIFSLAANRPVVVLPTFGHKITSGIDWFPADYKEYIYVAEDMHDVEAIIRKVEQAYSLPLSGRLPSYFKERYYDRLKEQIG